MNYEPFLRSELVPLKLILEEIPRFLAGRRAAIGDGSDSPYAFLPLLTAQQAYAVAEIRILECLLHVLNAIVDGSLLALANHVRQDTDQADPRRTRTVLLREIETALATRAGLHPGWNQVEILREETNAIKHRMGILGAAPDPVTGLSRIDTVKVRPDTALQRIEGVEAWLASLSRLARTR